MNTKYIPSIPEILLKPIFIFISLLGVYLQSRLDGGFFRTNVYLYFTIFSNTGASIIFLVFFILEIIERIKKQPLMSKWLFTVKYMFTAALLITLTVAATLLAPFKDQAYLFSVKNLSVHIFAPLFAVIDFLLFDKRFKVTFFTPFIGLIFPAIYSVLTLLLSIKGIHYSNGTIYPYFFFNWRDLGWWTLSKTSLGVGWWLIIIGVAALILSSVLATIKHLITKRYSRPI